MAARPRPALLSIEPLESRITPVVGKFDFAPVVTPGTGYDGVVQVFSGAGAERGSGTGSLLLDGRHVLTAAHVVATAGTATVSGPAQVAFDLPNVGRITIDVPAANIVIHPNYDTGTSVADLAILTLPVLAPSGGVGLGADRYPLYRNADEVGQTFTVVGYGTIGSGTTGEMENTNDTKGIARNRYEALGDRLGIGTGSVLLYDVDNGLTANDAFGRIFGLNELGFADEGTGASGDSGGPVFVEVGGQRFIAGTTTAGLSESTPPNPAVLNPAVKSGFGSISQDTRVSFFAAYIDQQTAGPAALVLDLRVQAVGQDNAADAVVVRAAGANLELVVNGVVYQSMPLADVTSLRLVGAGANATPFTTTATIQNGVPVGLAITYERILTVTDSRTGPPVVTAPAGDATTPPAVTPAPAPAEARRTTPVKLDDFPNAFTPTKLTAVGAGPGGGPVVDVYEAATGRLVRSITAFDPAFRGGVRTAVGDVNGDFVDDIIVAAGPGGGPQVKVFDGATGAVIRSFFAFDGRFAGGIFVAAGDVDGDGFDDIVVSAGPGGGPQVKVFDGATGAETRSFFAYAEAQRGGATVAVGDVNDDGMADIITGAGAGGAPHVKVFDGGTGAEMRSFFAYGSDLRGGVFVAAGDVDADGALDLVTGAGTGGAHVRTFDARTGAARLSFFAAAGETGGVRVAVADGVGDGLSDLVTATGAGVRPTARVFDGTTGALLSQFDVLDPAFLGGVFVGGRG